MYDMLTADQQNAVMAMKSGRNIFLTGKAGTGKTYTLHAYINCLAASKNVVVCAPTGVAAVEAGGVTLHRAFKLPIGIIDDDGGRPRRVPKVISSADVVVIDEISMVRYDTFRAVAQMLLRCKHAPQVIVIGDFLQLPPVITPGEKDVLRTRFGGEGYREGWAFETPEWTKMDFAFVELTKVIRQKESDYIDNLNLARVGDASCVPFFNSHTCQIPVNDGVCLVPRNATADGINRRRLGEINSVQATFSAALRGKAKLTDAPCDKELKLKKGARVMALVNDVEGDGQRFQNGSLGTVKRIDKSKKRVTVAFDNGWDVELKPNKWEVRDYKLVNADGGCRIESDVVGSVTQVPLRLAYAMTIHKAQGKTFEAVNIDPDCFAEGQLYVALSRCTDLSRMHLLTEMQRRGLKTSGEVVRFLDDCRHYANDGQGLLQFGPEEASSVEAAEQPMDGCADAGCPIDTRWDNENIWVDVAVPVQWVGMIERLVENPDMLVKVAKLVG